MLLALSAFLAGCLAWTEDSSGKLQSVGLPGVPVWTAQKPSPQAALAPGESSTAELASDGIGGASWLDELNRWRQAAGLQAVGENLELSDGSREHAQYLLENAGVGGGSVARAGLVMGAAMHHESLGSPGFSEEGAQAAAGGRHVAGVMQTAVIALGARNQKADVDSLLVTPFHRLSLLAPWAEVAGYGKAGTFPQRVGAMALRGRQGRDAGVVVRFPPDGSKVPFAAMRAPEWPNPLSGCPGYALPVGLPISLQVARPANIASYSISDLTTGQKLDACAFDALTYENPDPAQKSYAHQALSASKAIILIPRYPLQPGHQYQVAIEAGEDYRWSFAVEENADQLAAQEIAAPAAWWLTPISRVTESASAKTPRLAGNEQRLYQKAGPIPGFHLLLQQA
jgi:hypothetical protein